MTNHTPAPWFIDGDGDIASGKDCCTYVAMGDIAGIAINNAADRDLILAAPDMYEALDRVLDFTVSDELRETVCNTLKKARGEQ